MELKKRIELKGIKHHVEMFKHIDALRKPKWVILSNPTSILDNKKAYMRQDGKGYSVQFHNNIFKHGKDVELKDYSKIDILNENLNITTNKIHIHRKHMSRATGRVSQFSSKGFSRTTSYYHRLFVPLKKEMSLGYELECVTFTSDTGWVSSEATQVVIKKSILAACLVKKENKNKKPVEHFLVIEANKKMSFNEFSDRAFAMTVSLGYITGYYAADQGYSFAFDNSEMKDYVHFSFTEYRNSIKSSYSPIHTNPYGYLSERKKLAKKYENMLEPISLNQLTILCNKVYESTDVSAILLLILEASIASILFMPGGFAIALEALSKIIVNDKKVNLKPIKDTSIAKKIRKRFESILLEETATLTIEANDYKALISRIQNFNQITNKSQLKAPFDLLKITLLAKDIEILNARNDLLHGRIPDISKIGTARTPSDETRDLYYTSMRLYTILSILILKWVGFNNKVVNFPKIHESFTKIKVNEEPFRQV